MPNLPTRNNNPGDLRYIGQEGGKPGEGGFAKFPTPEAGFGALMNDLQHKIQTHPDWTIADFSNTWAPPDDNNDTAQYTANLANQLKVSPTTKISELQPRLGHFAEAIAANEGYQGSLPGIESVSTPTSADQTAELPDWIKETLGVGATILGGVGGFLQQNAPEVAGIAATEYGGPAAGIAASTFVSRLMGGDNNQQQPAPQGQTQKPDIAGELMALSGNQSPNAHQISGIINQALQGTQSNRVFAGGQGKAGIGAMGVYGYVPDIDEAGNMDFTDAREKSNKNEAHAAELEQLAAGDTKVPIMSAINFAGQYLGRNRMLAPDQKRDIADKIGEYARAYGPSNGSLTAKEAVAARHQQYAATKGRYGELSTAQVEARKALAYGFREASLRNSANPELQQAAIDEQRKHIQAQSVMDRLHGKKAPVDRSVFKSAFLKTAARYAEIYIGDKIGGPIGAILGLVAGEHLNRAIAKKLSKTKFDTKEMRAAFDILHETKPDVYELLIKKLEANGIKFTPQEERGNKTAEELKKDVAGDFKTIRGLVKLKGNKLSTTQSSKGPQTPLFPKG